MNNKCLNIFDILKARGNHGAATMTQQDIDDLKAFIREGLGRAEQCDTPGERACIAEAYLHALLDSLD